MSNARFFLRATPHPRKFMMIGVVVLPEDKTLPTDTTVWATARMKDGKEVDVMGMMLGGDALSPPSMTIDVELDSAVEHGDRFQGQRLDQVLVSGVLSE